MNTNTKLKLKIFFKKNAEIVKSLEQMSKLLTNARSVYLISDEDKHAEKYMPKRCLFFLRNDSRSMSLCQEIH
jgi:hypothetical protein